MTGHSVLRELEKEEKVRQDEMLAKNARQRLNSQPLFTKMRISYERKAKKEEKRIDDIVRSKKSNFQPIIKQELNEFASRIDEIVDQAN